MGRRGEEERGRKGGRGRGEREERVEKRRNEGGDMTEEGV